MKNKKERQEYLQGGFGFTCSCDCCKDDDDETYENFQKLQQDAEKNGKKVLKLMNGKLHCSSFEKSLGFFEN